MTHPALEGFSPAVQRWFEATYPAPSPPQVAGWPVIARGEHLLLMAPTGSGKTLAAFLWSLDALSREAAAGPLAPPGVRTLYLSPLKALGYDVEHNLRAPLAGIRREARRAGLAAPPVTVAVRTGDTPPSVRTAMVRRPPQLLVTTPESLFLLLSSPRAHEMLATVRTVIVDEIHALCGNKRGSHLALSLERLAGLVDQPFQRIGLSATQRPLEEVARFLGGLEDAGEASGEETGGRPRPVTVVRAGGVKALDVQVVTAVPDLTVLPEGSIWPELLPAVLALVRAHRSTLIFVSMRAQAERIARQLNDLAAEPLVRVHHGSLAQELRREVERALKAGAVRALVATGTLELGIDVGEVDLVIQIQSPGEVTRALQRVGRAGHQLDAVSRGRIFPTFREDLVACTVIARRMGEGWVEAVRIPEGPLDVLAQHVVTAVAMAPTTGEALRRVFRRAWPYRHLGRPAFEAVLRLLTAERPAPGQRAFVTWDPATDRLRPLRGALPVALQNSGAIPDRGYFGLYLADGQTRLGELEEEFVYESVAGDTIQFGSSTWRVEAIDRERVLVTPNPGAPARTPFWKGGLQGRDPELGEAIGAFRRELGAALSGPDPVAWLQERYPVDRHSAENLVAYLGDALGTDGVIPTDRTVVVERFRDELGDHRVAVLSSFGARLHAPLAMALRRALRARTGVDPQVLWDDDALVLRTPADGDAPPPGLLALVPPAGVEDLVVAELGESPLFGTLFRQNAARSLLLTGRRPRRTPLWLQRLRARDLLEAVRDQPDHPVRLETYRECLRDHMDVPALVRLLTRLETGELQLVERTVRVPSPMTLGALHRFTAQYMYEYDEPRAERQLRRLQLNRELLDQILGEGELSGLLEPEVARALEDTWQGTAPGARARDVEELFALLGRLGEVVAGPDSLEELARRATVDPAPLVETLLEEGRACLVELPPAGPGAAERAQGRLIPAARLARLRLAVHPAALRLLRGSVPPARAEDDLTPAEARRERLHHLLATRGPTPLAAIPALLGVTAEAVAPALEALVADGTLRRGELLADRPAPQVVTRQNLEILHRRTLAHLRRQVEPCDLETLQAFLLAHQHVDPETRLLGEEALGVALEQLAGRLVPAPVLEGDVLRARLTGYVPEWLDRAVASGEVVWSGLPVSVGARRRLMLAFREDLPLLGGAGPTTDSSGVAGGAASPDPAGAPEDEDGPLLADAQDLAALREALRVRGASFLFELTAATGLEAARVVPALWSLLFRGEVTNDHVETLRRGLADGFRPPESHVNPLTGRPRGGRPARRPPGRRGGAAGGRWSLVPRGAAPLDAKRLEWLTWQLLGRYGVVSLELVAEEALPCRWGAIYGVLRRLELSGEVRRGLFVQGLRGAQFALPEAVEALRALREAPRRGEAVLVSACDPAVLPRLAATEAAPWPARVGFARVPSAHLVFEDGRATLWAEQRGARVHLTPECSPEALVRAARALADLADRPARLGGQRRLVVSEIDGGPAREAPARASFLAAGYGETGEGLRWMGPPPRGA